MSDHYKYAPVEGTIAWVIPVVPPRRLCGRFGPLVVGVMSDASPELIREWT